VSLAILGTSSFAVNAQARLTEQSKVTLYGIGSVRAGMTIKEAEKAASVRFVQIPSGGEEYKCFYFKPSGGFSGVSFMVTKGRIARVDIENPRITTIGGAKIGDSEQRIKSLYLGQIQVTKHPYEGSSPDNGHYLIFTPRESKDRSYRIIFETNKNRVTRYRAGQLPEVDYIEGCL
jgi:hypothetical protein